MLKTDTRLVNWRRANPAKYDAHLAVQRAVKAGEPEKQTCEVCGVGAVDAHHDRYDKPLKYDGFADYITPAFTTAARICSQFDTEAAGDAG